MATTYDPAVGLGTPAYGDAYEATLDANRAVIATYLANLAVRPTEIPSASLNVKVAPGVYSKQTGLVGTYAGASSLAIPASSTTMLWLTEAGVIGSGTAWPATGTFVVRLAVVVSGAATVTSITPAIFIPLSVSA